MLIWIAAKLLCSGRFQRHPYTPPAAHGHHFCSFMFNPQDSGAAEDGLRRLQQLVDVAAPVAMVLLERWRHDKAMTDAELAEALNILESDVLRRSVGGAETRSGGQLFAALAQRITADRPLARLTAALARDAKGAELPDDGAFTHALTTQDLYGRRNLKFLLERLTNAGKKKTHTENLTIEHVLPQKKVLAPEWFGEIPPRAKGFVVRLAAAAACTWWHRLSRRKRPARWWRVPTS